MDPLRLPAIVVEAVLLVLSSVGIKLSVSERVNVVQRYSASQKAEQQLKVAFAGGRAYKNAKAISQVYISVTHNIIMHDEMGVNWLLLTHELYNVIFFLWMYACRHVSPSLPLCLPLPLPSPISSPLTVCLLL